MVKDSCKELFASETKNKLQQKYVMHGRVSIDSFKDFLQTKKSLTSEIFLLDKNVFPFFSWKKLTGTKSSYMKLGSDLKDKTEKLTITFRVKKGSSVRHKTKVNVIGWGHFRIE